MLYNTAQKLKLSRTGLLAPKSLLCGQLPFLLFSDDLSSLASLLLILSRAGRELILIRARVAVISSNQTTLPKIR